MNINLRISTDPSNTSDHGCQAPINTMNDKQLSTTPTGNTQGTSSATQAPSQSGNDVGNSSASLPSTSININNQISTDSKPLDTANPSNNGSITSTGNKSDSDWAKSLVTEMKGMFDTFVTTLTKLIESIFGAKAATQTPASTSQVPSQGTQNSPAQTTSNPADVTNAGTSNQNRVVESFIAHTAKTLGSDLNNVSEEKMRESVIMYQLYQKDEEAESVFKTALTQNKSNGKSSDEAIKAALIETEKTNKIQRWESDWVYSLSFQAAQLDNDLNSVSGVSSNLPAAAAIQTAERNLVSIATGAATPVQRSIAA